MCSDASQIVSAITCWSALERTLNQRVAGSSPARLTITFSTSDKSIDLSLSFLLSSLSSRDGKIIASEIQQELV